jgi:hypothetical protein
MELRSQAPLQNASDANTICVIVNLPKLSKPADQRRRSPASLAKPIEFE